MPSPGQLAKYLRDAKARIGKHAHELGAAKKRAKELQAALKKAKKAKKAHHAGKKKGHKKHHKRGRHR